MVYTDVGRNAKMTIDWTYTQDNSDDILASGLSRLTSATGHDFDNPTPSDYGNYLITHNSTRYIGEAKDLSKRIKQQSKDRTSTFFKNYLKQKTSNPTISQDLKITDFQIRTIKTKIGRKEIEEFGIVNLPTTLNKFQIDKRDRYNKTIKNGLWVSVQNQTDQLLKQGEQELHRTKATNWFDARPPSTPGLYWVEHDSCGLIYIGESSDILSRWKTHSGTTYFSALRRHIGENILDFYLQTIKGKKRYFTDQEDRKVTDLLKHTTIKIFPVQLGRYEIEEYLIRKHRPLLNRKENKKAHAPNKSS